MKIIFLGSGSAFTVGGDNFHSNILLMEDNHQTLLIDCGSDARLALHARGMSHRHINEVYISHMHADHVGGLEWLAFCTKFDPECTKRPTLHMNKDCVESLWNHVLSGGLSSLPDEKANIATYFDVDPIPNGGPFRWQNIDLTLVPTLHIISDKEKVPTYGLFFLVNGVKVLITTDTKLFPELEPYYQKADIIFHDCETAKIKSGVHAHYTELVHLDPAIKAKMWLYHYHPGPLPDAIGDGFRGFVKCGQVFEFPKK